MSTIDISVREIIDYYNGCISYKKARTMAYEARVMKLKSKAEKMGIKLGG